MASKIQLKRGLKSALPTLSSGEPAYTTDTRELYIGTGSGNVNMGGSHWYTGTAMSGTSSTTGAYSYSECPQVKLDDMYLNTSNGNVYVCAAAGSGTGAKWTYKGSIKGATGTTGATGADGQDSQAVYSTEPVQIGTWIDGKAVMRECGKKSYTSTTAAELFDDGFNRNGGICGVNYMGSTGILREDYFVYKNSEDDGNTCHFSRHQDAVAKIKEFGEAHVKYVVEYIKL